MKENERDRLRVGALDGRQGQLGRWHVQPLGADHQGRLRVKLTRDDGASVELMIHPAGTEPRAFSRTRAGDVTYVQRSGLDEREAVRLGRAFARNLERSPGSVALRFPHIAPSLALTSGAAREAPKPRELLFDPPGLAELLEPWLTIGGPDVAGFGLRSIQLPMTTHSADSVGTYLLELERTDDEERLVFVEIGTDAWRVFGSVGPLTIGVRPFGRATSHDELLDLDLASFLSHLLMHLESALENVTLRFPKKLDELRALSVPDEGRTGAHVELPVESAVDAGDGAVLGQPVLNLAVDAECGQACTFCSVKTYLEPSDGGDEELDRLVRELARARGRGVREVRLNGIDPLGFSRVLELVEAIRARGFERMTVFTTATRFSDHDFAERFVERAPKTLQVFVPVYGTDAETHDAVTGRTGSFAQVTEAVDVLQRLLRPPAEVVLSTIILKQNVEQLPAMLAEADQRGLRLYTHLPYPMRQSLLDPYLECALTESELLRRALDVDSGERVRRELAHLLPHPCVLLAEERRRGLTLFGLRDPDAPTRLHGTEYRQTSFTHVGSDPTHEGAFAVATVPCPHLDECALAPTCAREQYTVYAQRHGWTEMSPISPQALYALKGTS